MARLLDADLLQLNEIINKSIEIYVLDESAISKAQRCKDLSIALSNKIEARAMSLADDEMRFSVLNDTALFKEVL
jgi:hypothetical protein